jgi:hypothetical protein
VRSLFANIDTSRPLTSAEWTVSVKRGQTAMLPYRVTDSGSPTARVTVRITHSKATRRLAAWSFTAPSDERLRHTSFTCDLKPGTYHYAILATDEAGNSQDAADWKWLHV